MEQARICRPQLPNHREDSWWVCQVIEIITIITTNTNYKPLSYHSLHEEPLPLLSTIDLDRIIVGRAPFPSQTSEKLYAFKIGIQDMCAVFNLWSNLNSLGSHFWYHGLCSQESIWARPPLNVQVKSVNQSRITALHYIYSIGPCEFALQQKGRQQSSLYPEWICSMMMRAKESTQPSHCKLKMICGLKFSFVGYRANLTAAGDSDQRLQRQLQESASSLSSLSMDGAVNQMPRLQVNLSHAIPNNSEDPTSYDWISAKCDGHDGSRHHDDIQTASDKRGC